MLGKRILNRPRCPASTVFKCSSHRRAILPNFPSFTQHDLRLYGAVLAAAARSQPYLLRIRSQDTPASVKRSDAGIVVAERLAQNIP